LTPKKLFYNLTGQGNKIMSYEDKTDKELVDEAGRARLIDSAPVEMMRRLKNAIQDLDKNTKNYSGKLIDLTILLFFVALIQVFISVIAIPETWLIKILIFGTVVYVIYYIVRRITEERKNKIIKI